MHTSYGYVYRRCDDPPTACAAPRSSPFSAPQLQHIAQERPRGITLSGQSRQQTALEQLEPKKIFEPKWLRVLYNKRTLAIGRKSPSVVVFALFAVMLNKVFFFFFFASTSVVRRVWGTYVSRLLCQPAGVCSQAAREQLTQRHLLVVI